MKLIYRGTFDGNTESLPSAQPQPGAVRFKEFDDPKKMGLFANVASAVLLVVLLGAFLTRLFLRYDPSVELMFGLLPGFILPLLALFPHELLHALCFRGEVHLFTNLSQGMLFVVGPETMSKGRFLFMSLLPNLVFGFIPYLIAMCFPSLGALGIFGAMSIGMGAGDYYNVFNALTQMPKGARTYLHQFHSYWYIPE